MLDRDVTFTPAVVLSNESLSTSYALLKLSLPERFPASAVVPGQFVMLRGPWGHHPLLPRAFSILDVAPGQLELLIKRVGRGTHLLGALPPGAAVTVLGPLGQAFPAPLVGVRDILVGGGSGIPPLYLYAARVVAQGRAADLKVIYGGRQAADLVLMPRLEEHGIQLYPCTEDGSLGDRGLVTDVLATRLSEGAARVLACGPLPMLRAISAMTRKQGVPCFISLETEMACGVGICRGCSVARSDGSYLCTCQEGPVVAAEEVIL